MPTFYFATETTGINPVTDKLITIQFQELDKNTAQPIGPLVILKEWESDEKSIIEHFLRAVQFHDEYDFSFVPIGYNLGFDRKFLRARCRAHQLADVDILNKPFIDLRPLGIIFNKGEFKGSGLEKLTHSPLDPKKIPDWYATKEYDKIASYVQLQTHVFLRFAQWAYKHLPKELEKFKSDVP